MTRKIILALTVFGLSAFQLRAQNFDDTRQYFLSLENQVKKDSNLMSYPALNILMAKKVNAYISGSSDLSLNKSYFIVDPTDGRLFLGYNFAKDPSRDSLRTKWVLNAGLKTNITDAFSTLYSGAESKWARDMGLSLKFTWLGRGIIYFDTVKQVQRSNLKAFGLQDNEDSSFQQVQVAQFIRRQIYNELDSLMKIDSVAFEQKIRNAGTSAYRAQKRQEFFVERNKYYRNAFVIKEAEQIESAENYNSYWNHWVSLDMYLPFTNKESDVAVDFLSSVESKALYNFEANLLWSNIYENKCNKLFATVMAGVKSIDNISTSMIDKYSIGDYKKLGGADTVKLAQLESKDVYIGKYSSYITPVIRFQVVDLFFFKKQLGLSFMAEKYLSEYNPLNIKVGVPFNLTGKDDETTASFELQFKWNDINNTVFPNKRISEKFLIGLSVGIPLSSEIY